MIKLFVPGRLCLFGEHTDWAGHYRTMNADIAPGAAIVTGIEQGIYAEVEKSSIFELYSEGILSHCDHPPGDHQLSEIGHAHGQAGT